MPEIIELMQNVIKIVFIYVFKKSLKVNIRESDIKETM